MADFFATYSTSNASSATVTANQGTSPWIVAGGQTAGVSGTAVLTVQGIAGGTAVPISGSITATNPSVSATGSAVPASGTYIAASVAGTLTGLVATANGLKVDGSAATQPVSGTVAATQSGTWTVQPGNTANTTPWLTTVAQGGNSATVSVGGALKVDGSAATQPVSQAVTTAAFQAEGATAFGSITNSYVTIFTPAANTKILQLRNNTNAAVSVSFDAGSTTNYTLDAGDQVSLDLKANWLAMSTTAIQIKYAVGAPTSGSFRVNGAA